MTPSVLLVIDDSIASPEIAADGHHSGWTQSIYRKRSNSLHAVGCRSPQSIALQTSKRKRDRTPNDTANGALRSECDINGKPQMSVTDKLKSLSLEFGAVIVSSPSSNEEYHSSPDLLHQYSRSLPLHQTAGGQTPIKLGGSRSENANRGTPKNTENVGSSLSSPSGPLFPVISVISDDVHRVKEKIAMEHSYNVVVMGPSKVGKTAIIRRLIKDTFHASYRRTLGIKSHEFHCRVPIVLQQEQKTESEMNGQHGHQIVQTVQSMSSFMRNLTDMVCGHSSLCSFKSLTLSLCGLAVLLLNSFCILTL